MNAEEFAAYHQPTLEASEVRNGLILALIARAAGGAPDVMLWSLGAPGRCALRTPGRSIVLGELTQADCRRLAELTAGLDYPGVLGQELTARWFAERAVELGHAFGDVIPHRIHALTEAPAFPGAAGAARKVTAEDAALFTEWMIAFHDEAVPHEPTPDRAHLEQVAGEGRYWFWQTGGEPVSVAGIVRRTRNSVSIAGVYTPPTLRGRGYAGSVTATIAAEIVAEGKTASLFTDLRNPASNRCYARIGFKPVTDGMHILRTDLRGQMSGT